MNGLPAAVLTGAWDPLSQPTVLVGTPLLPFISASCQDGVQLACGLLPALPGASGCL